MTFEIIIISVYLLAIIILLLLILLFKNCIYKKTLTELKNNYKYKFNSKIDDYGLSIIICAKNELENLKQIYLKS